MDAFALRDEVIHDYAKYVHSFLTIRDERAADYVRGQLLQGLLWPEALVQLSPAYEPGPTNAPRSASWCVGCGSAAEARACSASESARP